MSVIQRSIQVGWQLRVFFTENVFAPDNPVLKDALADIAPRKVFVVVEASLAQALPELVQRIEEYFSVHAGSLKLVHPPLLSVAARPPRIPPRSSVNSTRTFTATTLTGIRI